MIYLFESKLPETKSVYFALRFIYGIGKSKAFFICKMLGFSPNLKIKNLSEDQIHKIIKLVDFLPFLVSNDLRRVRSLELQRLISIKSYRGLRRKKGFPVRGQRTKTKKKTARRTR